MASKERWKESYRTSGVAYKVFRELVKSPNGSYSKDIQREMDSGASEDITRLLSALKEEGIAEKGEWDKGQNYIPEWGGLAELQAEMLESSDSLDPEILKIYVDRYVHFNKESSMRDMLRDDFVSIFLTYDKCKDGDHKALEFVRSLDKSDMFDRRFFEIAETVVERK